MERQLHISSSMPINMRIINLFGRSKHLILLTKKSWLLSEAHFALVATPPSIGQFAPLSVDGWVHLLLFSNQSHLTLTWSPKRTTVHSIWLFNLTLTILLYIVQRFGIFNEILHWRRFIWLGSGWRRRHVHCGLLLTSGQYMIRVGFLLNHCSFEVQQDELGHG